MSSKPSKAQLDRMNQAFKLSLKHQNMMDINQKISIDY